MLKARNRKLSMLLVLAMLMTMFVGVGTANADATTYTCLQVPYLAPSTTVSSSGATLGTILVDWPLLTAGTHSAILTLPQGLEFGTTPAAVIRVTKQGTGVSPSVINPSPVVKDGDKEVKIEVAVSTQAAIDAQIAILLEGVNVKSSAPAGPAEATFTNLAGLFPPSKVTIGNVMGSKTASVSVVETQTITGGTTPDIQFTIAEGVATAIEPGTTKALTFKLPNGFAWSTNYDAVNLTTGATSSGAIGWTFDREDNNRVLVVTTTTDSSAETPVRSVYRITAGVSVDETVATFGDVMVQVKSKNEIIPTEVKIGTFSDYGYKIEVKDPAKEILAGRIGDDAEISSFRIKEDIPQSLLTDRTIYLELPDGIHFYDNNTTSTGAMDAELSRNVDATPKAGQFDITWQRVSNKPNMVKGTISKTTAKGEVEIEAKVRVAVDYEGDINLKLSGSAGVNDTITVGKVVKPVTAKADVVDVKIGSQAQKAGNITITEIKPETLVTTDNATLTLTAPTGVSFANLPDVKVVEGDLTIGTQTLRMSQDGTRNNILYIPVRSTSNKVSTIEVSNIAYSLDRTVPEGDLVIDIGGTAVDRADILNRDVAAAIIAANCVTPAPGEEIGNGQFNVDSNIYYVGGVAKVMEVAPYIKAGRTYVPMRVLGEDILGAEVVWDDAARTVTLTRGEDVVVFTIGSTTYTVNGETKTNDVEPEIKDNRTMLPARAVAEAFGAVVGWDPGTRTVLIQK